MIKLKGHQPMTAGELIKKLQRMHPGTKLYQLNENNEAEDLVLWAAPHFVDGGVPARQGDPDESF